MQCPLQCTTLRGEMQILFDGSAVQSCRAIYLVAKVFFFSLFMGISDNFGVVSLWDT